MKFINEKVIKVDWKFFKFLDNHKFSPRLFKKRKKSQIQQTACWVTRLIVWSFTCFLRSRSLPIIPLLPIACFPLRIANIPRETRQSGKNCERSFFSQIESFGQFEPVFAWFSWPSYLWKINKNLQQKVKQKSVVKVSFRMRIGNEGKLIKFSLNIFHRTKGSKAFSWAWLLSPLVLCRMMSLTWLCRMIEISWQWIMHERKKKA